MFGLRNQNRLDRVMQIIAAAGQATCDWFQQDDCCKFPNGERWISFCGTIPAFAYVIAHEAIIKGRAELSTPEQRDFFKSIEDALFTLYEKDEGDHMVPIRQCLLLESERTAVIQALQFHPDDPDDEVTLDTMVTPAMILGIILPNRLSNYQKDWISGFAPLVAKAMSGRHDFSYSEIHFSDYAAMRFAADLTGIVTPSSLVGHKALHLGIEAYPRANMVLAGFISAYSKEFP